MMPGMTAQPTLDARDARTAARAVARTLADAGHEALFVGGAVRDRLLGRVPGDWDVATSATPEEGLALFPRAVTVGAQFGVLIVVGAHHNVEVATFRDDGLYVDGRRPTEVRYSDARRDAARRDFTVNALFEDPVTGAIVDHVGGRQDLDRRLLRAIGVPGDRFREDHLRMLRAVRLAVQLDFAIEPQTLTAVRALAPLVADVSAERVRVELVKILRHGRGRGLRLLASSGLLPVVLPEIAAMRGVTQPPRYHPEGDVFVHTCLMLDAAVVPPSEDPEGDALTDLLLGVLLHDVAKPVTRTVDPDGRIRFNGHEARGAEMTREILERLRFPRRTIERVEALVVSHMRFPNLPQMREARLRRFLGDEDFGLHLSLHEADCLASHGDLSLAAFCRERLAAWAGEPVLPEPLLAGRDLLALGYAPGPLLGRILRTVRDLQLDGELDSRDAAVRRVRQDFPVPPHEV
jgi:poly(A) polymerase